MSFLDRAIKNGISKGVSDAIGKAVQKAVEPRATEYANKVAGEFDSAAQSISQQNEQVKQSANALGGLEGALANLQSSMESYATEAAKNTKICPKCQTPATADKKFCPTCGEKLPEMTLAQGAVCPSCGKQNTLGTRFCQECGAKLPFAEQEEQAQKESDAAVISQWKEMMPQYPVWSFGGSQLELEKGDGYFIFNVTLENDFAAQNAVNKYRELAMQNGFKQEGEYPCIEHLYKKIDGICYHVDTEHCFEGDSNTPSIYFTHDEPIGGFDYVKPQPKSFGLKDIFKF